MNIKQPLEVKVEKGFLTVSIGLNTLAFAADGSDAFFPYNEQQREYKQKYQVVDTVEWAKDVSREMLHESEDGSSLLTRFLDKAIVAALEDGSVAVEEVK